MKVLIPLFALLLGGCVVTPSAPISVGATPMCSSDAECAVKWAAARTYVLAHAGMKIQNYAPDYLETYGSTDNFLAAQVNKVPLPYGGYAIAAKFWCGNGRLCMQDPQAVLAGFNSTVNAIGSLPAPTGN
jgi:hypothetical protein